ncbi:hypothetical protein [Ruegeria sp. A3M17]|uniref:hypothetical protein n=1 Tax=Ruegeria sp. A3M17 TaxID=2267229 RepID=UPI000DEA8E6D|nr:hypothetical protein [Ruegeria sp. A3M17]RBW53752.1 hypothetical protein DS906_17590 [Ruegeria sp. A3M17]
MDQDDGSSHNEFGNPGSIDDMVAMYLEALEGVLGSLRDYSEKGARVEPDVMFLLAQAQARWLSSALRYWQQIATIVSTQGTDAIEATIPSADGPSLEARQLIVLDKARAVLREISDLSLSEAKLLQRDLMEIEAELRKSVGPVGDDREGPHRYAKSKP